MDNMCNSDLKSVVKIDVISLEIVVRSIDNKPYFELKYITIDGEVHIGYGSYDLTNVIGWKEECFNLVEPIK